MLNNCCCRDVWGVSRALIGYPWCRDAPVPPSQHVVDGCRLQQPLVVLFLVDLSTNTNTNNLLTTHFTEYYNWHKFNKLSSSFLSFIWSFYEQKNKTIPVTQEKECNDQEFRLTNVSFPPRTKRMDQRHWTLLESLETCKQSREVRVKYRDLVTSYLKKIEYCIIL